jgi:phosphoglycerate dehydrogenase-like enzyme
VTTVLCQQPIENQQKALLCNEFPRCRFIFSRECDNKALISGHLKLAEVFFGYDLTARQLEEAPHLRWVQSPHPDLRKLPISQIAQREDILVTATPPAEIRQMGEYVMAAMLSVAKNLPAWYFLGKEEQEGLWNSTIAEQMWTLENRIFLQVGLGDVGTEMVRRAGQFGMRVRAVHHNRSYNPFVEHPLSDSELHSVLPAADVVSVSLPYAWRYHHSFGKDEFSLMKKGAILIVTGAGGVVDEEALLPFVEQGKFRGVILDAVENPPLSHDSPWWSQQHALITPGVAHYPKESSVQPFRVFRRNLRHYIPGNYVEMRGKVDIDLWSRSGVSGRKTF